MSWVPGQRVLSTSEPELGLGMVLESSEETIAVQFELVNDQRVYSLHASPLRRYTLHEADEAILRDGTKVTVTSFDVLDGLYYYHTKEQSFFESELSAKPLKGTIIESLRQGEVSPFANSLLRQEAWEVYLNSFSTATLGFVGPRVQPIGHQLHIAEKVTERSEARALLADEVGLGKTIEAGLMMSRMTRLYDDFRIVAIVPDPLMHQWLSEMFRRFGLLFSLMDRERFDAELASQDGNPFELASLVLLPESLLDDPKVTGPLQVSKWDLVVVDEAHHHQWSPEGPSPSWQVLLELQRQSLGLLLLTATPERHGLETLFGLLHLLDQDFFADFDSFRRQTSQEKAMAQIAKSLQSGEVAEDQVEELEKLFPGDQLLMKACESGDSAVVLNALVDRHATGHYLFRNRRKNLGGFPKRLTTVHEKGSDLNERVEGALAAIGKEKVLVMADSSSAVESLRQSFPKAALFHEEMEIVERDKQAAWFADPEGADLLITSPIGGEGRNFQFCQHLVLTHLPENPDVLEQHIGRLDRIGQKGPIQIHVLIGSDSDKRCFQWHNEVLGGFEKPFSGAGIFYEEQEDLITAFINEGKPDVLKQLKKQAEVFAKKREEGADILLDYTSANKERADALEELVEEIEDNPSIEFFMRSFLDHYGVHYEDYDDRGSLIVQPDNLSFISHIPGLANQEELLVTFSREVALEREESVFMSQDHEFVGAALAMLIEKGEGAISVGRCMGRLKEPLIQLIWIVEAAGEQLLQLEKFFVPEMIVQTCTFEGRLVEPPKALSDSTQVDDLRKRDVPFAALAKEVTRVSGKLEPVLVEQIHAKGLAAANKARETLEQEIEYQRYLTAINPAHGPEHLQQAEARAQKILQSLESLRPRLDSIRIIVS